MGKKLFVGNLPFDTSDEQLRALFDEYGDVKSAIHSYDKKTNRPRGFGFVEMYTDDGAALATEKLNRSNFHGRYIVVNEAREREGQGNGPQPMKRAPEHWQD